LVDAGAALMFREGETDAHSIAEAVSSLLENEDKRRDMAERAQEAARPEAAAEIVEHCLAIMESS
ncbi:MAG: UDP-N-acetylglucosamine--N-acetylmuramyl-(pentapeptide) pyrophosphoryl-undecaprenol N-acetylglucosamine transferase, partial [bacterium]